MNALSLTEAVPTHATTPRDHLLVSVQLVWSWILEKEVAKVKLIFTICAHVSMSPNRGEVYVHLLRYQIRCCTQWSCRKYVKCDRSDVSTTIFFRKSPSKWIVRIILLVAKKKEVKGNEFDALAVISNCKHVFLFCFETSMSVHFQMAAVNTPVSIPTSRFTVSAGKDTLLRQIKQLVKVKLLCTSQFLMQCLHNFAVSKLLGPISCATNSR